MLYDRDYRKLTDEEIKILDEADSKVNNSINGNTLEELFDSCFSLSFAMHCYKSIFPNNYLCPFELSKRKEIEETLEDFKNLLDSNITERDILNFVRDRKAYFIISGLFNSFDFGHHDAYLFKEFDLPPLYKCDYLLVGKNSGGYEFVFIELENPYDNITTQKGDLGGTIRKGLNQIDDWDQWIETNYSHLKLVFESKAKSGELLPKEFYELDKSRIHYIVVAGRRKDYSDKTYRIRRKKQKEKNVKILHYDNLIDNAYNLIENATY